MYPAVDKVDGPIEKVWPRHQHHARADRDKAQRRAHVVVDGETADEACQHRRGERLDKHIVTQPSEATANDGASASAEEDEQHGDKMFHTEDHGECRSAHGGREREEPGWGRWRPRNDMNSLSCRSEE